MYMSYCSLYCALEKLRDFEIDNKFIANSIKHLELAVSYAKEYDEVWNSIYWNSATANEKRRIRQKLNVLAFDSYSEFLLAITDINAFCDVQYERECQKLEFTPIPNWWNDMMISLILAEDSFLKEHRCEISSKQLSLFE